MSRRSNTIYVAGPMRGYENWNHDAFNRRSEFLKRNGWNVINPAEMDIEQEWVAENSPHEFNPDEIKEHQEHLREILLRDFTEICKNCGAIYMMDGWHKSKGAKAEHTLAIALGIKIYYETPMPDYGYET